MNVGAIGLVALGGLLMHAGFTGQSPLTDLKSIFQGGAAASIPLGGNGTGISGTGIPGTQNTVTTQGTPGTVKSGPDPLTPPPGTPKAPDPLHLFGG